MKVMNEIGNIKRNANRKKKAWLKEMRERKKNPGEKKEFEKRNKKKQI